MSKVLIDAWPIGVSGLRQLLLRFSGERLPTVVIMQRCEVFLGTTIEDRNERRFLRRVRADLERRDCAARILANFMAGRDQRQVDFLVSTRHRLVHVELKTADQALPLFGGPNGAWEQRLPDGKRRSLEGNYYRQAHSTT